MNKVLVVACNNLGTGGVQNVIMSIVRGLNKSCQFDAIVFDHDYIEYEEEFLKQGEIYTLGLFPKNRSFRSRLDFYIRPLYLYTNFLKIMKEKGPYDIVHCHNYYEEALALKAAYKCKIPIRIAHNHTLIPVSKKNVLRKIYNYIYRKMINKYATSLVACSKSSGLSFYGSDNRQLMIENAVDSKVFNYVNGDNIDPWSFLHIGRWGGPKNQLFLLDVFSELCKYNSNSVLSLVGYGDENELERINEKAKELGVIDRIRFYPSNSNISALMQTNNIFIFPSLFEGLGIVLIEAQSTGMKCFASTAVPVDSNLGLVDYIPLDSGPFEWALRISKYINEYGSLRKKVNLNGFDIENNINKYRQLYKLGD